MQVFLDGWTTVDLLPDALAKLAGQPRWGVTPSDRMGTMRRIDLAPQAFRVAVRRDVLGESVANWHI